MFCVVILFFSETSALSVNTKENKLVHCNVTRVVTPQQSPTSINGSWILCTATLPLALSDWGPLSLDHLLFCEDCKSTAWQSVYGSWAPCTLCRWRWLVSGGNSWPIRGQFKCSDLTPLLLCSSSSAQRAAFIASAILQYCHCWPVL